MGQACAQCEDPFPWGHRCEYHLPCSSAPWLCAHTQGPHSKAAQSRDPLEGHMQTQERPSPSAAKDVHWRNWLPPGWDCEDPAAGAGHEAWCRRAATQTTPSKRRKGKREEEVPQEGRVVKSDTQDTIGQRWAGEGCGGKRRRSRQVLRVRGAASCGLRRAEKS